MRLSRPLRRTLRIASLAAAGGILHGCAGVPSMAPATDTPQDAVPAPTVVLPVEATAYELRQRDRAIALARQGRLADAALIWELLVTIRPRVAEYRERGAEVQKQIATGVADRLQRGEQAASRGQLDGATQQYLAALALQPDNTKAAEALRSVERERIKRTHLGKLSRNTLTRRAMADAEMVATGDDDPPTETLTAVSAKPESAEEGSDLEQAARLSGRGDWDEAITLLERHLRANRRDDAARVMLADVYFQKAEALAARNRSAAISLLERSVRTDPTHARAADRLKQLRLVAAANRPASAPIAASPASSPARTAAVAAAPNNTVVANTAVTPAVATIVSPAASSPQAPPRR